MASQSSAKSIDLQGLLGEAVKFEVRSLSAGAEYLQAWIGQAAKLVDLAETTLHDIEEDKGSLSKTARALVKFGQQNADAFSDLSGRFSRLYFEEINRFVDVIESKGEKRQAPNAKSPPRSRRSKKAESGARSTPNA
ncbi:MAG TPA: hypothetical protein VMM15_33100 [Bradyrhizobium sp.]|nr:hypothetical protein [Bradyrhizobium sp.]